MAINVGTNEGIWEGLSDHVGHELTVHWYGDPANPICYSLECETCGEVVLSAERPEEEQDA